MNVHAARVVLVAVCLVTTQACTSAMGDGSGRGSQLPPGISQHFAGLMALHEPQAFRAAAVERGFLTTGEGVVLDIQTQGLEPAHRAAFDLPGLEVRSFRPEYERVSAVTTGPDPIRTVAELPFVRQVAPSFGATTGGSTNSRSGGY